MAATTCMVNSAKGDFLAGRNLAADTYKMALIKVGHSGTYDALVTGAGTPGSGAPTTSNLGTDEVAASGTYSAGGFTMAGYTAGASGGHVVDRLDHGPELDLRDALRGGVHALQRHRRGQARPLVARLRGHDHQHRGHVHDHAAGSRSRHCSDSYRLIIGS